MRKLGIYVQVPFCQTKCTYCNFHTGVVASSRFAPYVAMVCREIREHRELLKAARVDWAGRLGGTPRLLDPAHLQNILEAIRETFVLSTESDGLSGKKCGGEPPHSKTPTFLPSARALSEQAPGGPYGERFEEVTLEADPETIEAGKAVAWVRAAFNRVSFGLQSFSDKELVAAGRKHRR